jgi:predicted PurR-regulated permease PerM
VLWGILTFFLEFIPYLGGASMLILLTLAGLASFDRIGQVLLPPLVYLAVTTLQNNPVSPVAYGLRLNPVAVRFWRCPSSPRSRSSASTSRASLPSPSS